MSNQKVNGVKTVAAPPLRSGAWGALRKNESLLVGAIAAITALVYLRCLGNGYVFDDHEMIIANRYIGDWSFLWKALVNDSWWFRDPTHLPQSHYYRPLQDIWPRIVRWLAAPPAAHAHKRQRSATSASGNGVTESGVSTSP